MTSESFVHTRCANPSCQHKYRVKSELLGETATCRACGTHFRIEALGVNTGPPSETKPTRTPAGRTAQDLINAGIAFWADPVNEATSRAVANDSINVEEPANYAFSIDEDLSPSGDDSTVCPFCGESIKQTAIICKHCKSALNVAAEVPARNAQAILDAKFCHVCGASIRSRAEICPNCGVRQPLMGSGGLRRPEKSRVGAAVLALFLGGLGVHKFYLGEVGMGVLYLLFCWTLIPAFVALIEALVYLTMSDEAFAAKYG